MSEAGAQMPPKRCGDLEHCDEMIAWARGLKVPGNPQVDICDCDWNSERALILEEREASC